MPLVNESSTAPSFTANDNRNGIRRTACGKSEDDRTPSPWFFRVGPDDSQSADQFEQFLLAERRRGFTVNRIAILHEDSDIYGDSVSAVTKRLARRLGLRDADIKDVGYPTVLGQPAVPPNSPCTASERKLNAKLEKGIAAIQDFEPDVLFLGGYKADAVATLQTMGKLDYEPPKVLAYGAGYEDKHYYRDVMRGRKECDLAPANPYGVITRVSWSLQLEGPARYGDQGGGCVQAALRHGNERQVGARLHRHDRARTGDRQGRLDRPGEDPSGAASRWTCVRRTRSCRGPASGSTDPDRTSRHRSCSSSRRSAATSSCSPRST